MPLSGKKENLLSAWTEKWKKKNKKKADKINSNNMPRFTNGVTEVKCMIIFFFVVDWNKCDVCCKYGLKINAR